MQGDIVVDDDAPTWRIVVVHFVEHSLVYI